MRRRADDLHATRGQVDDEHGVERHQAAPRPDLGREEIRAGDRAPVRPQKRLPRGRSLRHRRHARAPSGSGRSSSGRPDGRRSSARLGSACSPTWDSPRPSARTSRRISASTPGRPPRSLGVRPLARDQLSMPAQNRVGRDDRGDLTQGGDGPADVRATANRRRSSSVRRIRRSHLSAEDAVLFDQVGHGLPLALVEPADQRGQEPAEGRRVEHGGEVYTTARSQRPRGPSADQ